MSPHSLVKLSLEAICLKDSKLEVNSEELMNLINTNISMARGNPFMVDQTSMFKVDFREEPIIHVTSSF